jgi:hypothetical protein
MMTVELVAPSSAELGELCQRVEEEVAGGSSIRCKHLRPPQPCLGLKSESVEGAAPIQSIEGERKKYCLACGNSGLVTGHN